MATSSDVVVKTGLGTTTTTSVIHAPYGVRSEVVSVGGKTYATTTPLTANDVKKMENERVEFESKMNKLFEEQNKIFQEFWNDF